MLSINRKHVVHSFEHMCMHVHNLSVACLGSIHDEQELLRLTIMHMPLSG